MRISLPKGVGICREGELFRVRLGSKFTGGNPIIRRFGLAEEARTWINEQSAAKEKHGRGASALSQEEIAEAIGAFRQLKEASSRLGVALSLSDAVRFFLRRGEPEGGRKNVKELVEEWKTAKVIKGVSSSYLGGVQSTYDRFVKSFGPRLLHEITAKECAAWIHSKKVSDNSKIHYIKDLSILFSWAVDRKWLADNPWASVEAPLPDPVVVGILTVTQATDLLTAAVNQMDRPLLAYVVLGLFAGIRTTELHRLNWEAVRLGSPKAQPLVDLSAFVTKTQERRTVLLHSAAVEWLMLCSKRQGRVAPANCEARFQLLYSNAGITKYPKNALRHSYASYLYAKCRDASQVATSLGHTNLNTLKKHYVETCLPEDSEAYFSISPNGTNPVTQSIGTSRSVG